MSRVPRLHDCAYCGRLCRGTTCQMHADLPALDRAPRDMNALALERTVRCSQGRSWTALATALDRVSDFDSLERKATDIYGSAQSDWLLGFCQQVIAACCEARTTERAFAQACTNLAVVRPSLIEGATVGDDAERYYDALRAGRGGIEGWNPE